VPQRIALRPDIGDRAQVPLAAELTRLWPFSPVRSVADIKVNRIAQGREHSFVTPRDSGLSHRNRRVVGMDDAARHRCARQRMQQSCEAAEPVGEQAAINMQRRLLGKKIFGIIALTNLDQSRQHSNAVR
jgi:hypothetical protein